MSRDADFFAENTEQFAELTEAQQEAIFNGGVIDDQGDTGAEPETSDAPDAGNDSDDKPAEPELLAKDGKHTIPYSELVDARKSAAEWEQLSAQQAELIKALQSAKIEDAGTGDTKAQDAVLAEYQGEYTEIAEDMKPFIQKLIDEGIKAGMAAFTQQIEQRVAPVEKLASATATEKHFNAIRAEHPDFEQIAQDKQFGDWIDKQPSFMKDQCSAILERGTATQLNELFTAYKSANKVGPVTDVTGKAKDIIAKTKANAPGSLSDIPAGTTGQHDEVEAMRNMTPRQLEVKFANKSPDEVMKLMSRLV